MEHSQQILFGPFRLDPVNEQLWRGEQQIPLRAKSLAVLCYLAQHPGRLVNKEEIIQTVWADTYVTKTVLKVCIREIREALGEEVAAPQYIETMGRLGYRFRHQGTVEELESEEEGDTTAGPVVGRAREIAQLQRWLTKASEGTRQIIFVTGEPGIGKTTVVDLFVDHIRATEQVRIGRGQCLEQYGAGEAYLPVLEAFGQLCRDPGGSRLVDVLRQYAPTWLIQMPALLGEAELEVIQRTVAGATRERMLREMAEAIETLTAERGLVLVLEDLQWSDLSTLDLIAYLAQRRTRAQLCVVGTYRPTDVILSEHPLKGIKQEMQAHGQCKELRLELLSEEAVAEYVAGRFVASQVPPELAQLIYRRTDGNALFMVNMVEYFTREGLVRETDGCWELHRKGEDAGVPDSLRQLIEKQIERLSEEEQRVLEAASIAGAEFAVAAVAAGLKSEVEVVEEVCEELAWKGHFLQEEGLSEWPDGTVSGRYRFRHALYQNVLYDRVAEARRVRVHRRIGERAETAYGSRTREIAGKLAVYFEQGRDSSRALQYLRQAGEHAFQRSAHHEAIDYLTKGLALLKTLPDTPERPQQELMLQIALGVPLTAMKGYAAREVEQTYARAWELCQQVAESSQRFPVLWGLWVFSLLRAELHKARELGEQLLSLAQSVQDPPLLREAHHALGATSFWRGEFVEARTHLERGMSYYNPQHHHAYTLHSDTDPRVDYLSYAACLLWILGYPDLALKKGHEALSLAQELAQPWNLTYALSYVVWLRQFRLESQAAQEGAEALMTLSTEQGFPMWLAIGTILQGWARAEQGHTQEGIAQMRQGLAAFRATGAELIAWTPALLAEAYGKTKRVEEGLGVLAETLAFVHKSGQRIWEAELYRLKGELILNDERRTQNAERKKLPTKRRARNAQSVHQSSFIIHRSAEAEACFQQAIEIARNQAAKSLELRAIMSLSCVWQKQGKQKEARQLLDEIYHWFTEGFDTADLKEAKMLLEALA